MADTDLELRDRYFYWLSPQVSPAQLSELYSIYGEIEDYFRSRNVLKDPLFQTSDLRILSHIRSMIDGSKIFRFTHRRSLSKMSSAIRFYIRFIKENNGRPIDAPSAHPSNELTNSASTRQVKRDDNAPDPAAQVSDKHESDVQNAFIRWMLECGMSDRTVKSYSYAIKRIGKFAIEKGYIANSPFLITSPSTLRKLQDKLLKDASFSELNNQYHHLFGAALGKYIAYRDARDATPDTQKSEPVQRGVDTPANSGEFEKRCTSVLQECFPDGLRQNVIHIKKFIGYYEERFGALELSKEELLKALRAVGVVREGRIYPRQDTDQHPLFKKILSTIDRVFETGGTCVFLSMLLTRYRQPLAEQFGIYSEEALQAVFLERNAKEYIIRDGVISRANRLPDPAADVLNFMKSRHIPATYSEIQEKLWYIPMETIKHTLLTTPSLVNVDQAAYFYAPNLPISTDELCVLTRKMQEEIDAFGFLTGQQLKELMERHCPSAAIDMAPMKVWGIRNALGYILRDKFSFTGALVSGKDEQLTAADAYRNFCRGHKRLTLEQLKAFSVEIDARLKSNYWHAVFSQMIRISADTFVRKDQIHFDVQATDTILEEICPWEYIPLQEVGLYMQFPPIEIPWNKFVLECFLNHYSEKFKAIQPAMTQSGVYGVMARKNSSFTTYQQVVTDALAHSQEWSDRESAIAYLIRHGFQARSKLANADAIVKEALLMRERLESGKK